MPQNRCSLTYQPIGANERYSKEGLQRLSPTLTNLRDFPYTAAEQRQEAMKNASKISIQGVQPKLSARLSPVHATFEIVTKNGKFILKPQTESYEQLPENEDLSLRLAQLAGIEAPQHGLIRCADGSLTYFIKRMDRSGHKDKIPLEDFAQLSGATRDTKYESSVEKIIEVVRRFCTVPQLELKKLFQRVVFNFLIGNEDMHLKNYSLITRGLFHQLAPAYDFLNTTIALRNPKEETALPLNGKKNHLTRKDLLSYLPLDRMELNPNIVQDVCRDIQKALPVWDEWIGKSFLNDALKAKYRDVVRERSARLGF